MSAELDADLTVARERTQGMSRDKQVIAEMWAYHTDLTRQATTFAQAKSAYGQRVSKIVVQERANGEKSASAAEHTAESTDDVYRAHVAYRLAEQLITVDREALRILHGELDSIRTDRADARAADTFQARTS